MDKLLASANNEKEKEKKTPKSSSLIAKKPNKKSGTGERVAKVNKPGEAKKIKKDAPGWFSTPTSIQNFGGDDELSQLRNRRKEESIRF